MSCEVDRVDFSPGQIMPTSDVTLWSWLRKSWQQLDQIVFPSPRHDRAQVLAGLVGRSPWIRALVCDRMVVYPVEKVSNVLSAKFLDWNTSTPQRPFLECRKVLVLSSTREVPIAKITLHGGLEFRRHRLAPALPVLATMPDPLDRQFPLGVMLLPRPPRLGTEKWTQLTRYAADQFDSSPEHKIRQTASVTAVLACDPWLLVQQAAFPQRRLESV